MYLFIPYRTFYPFLSHFDIYRWRTSCVNNRSDVIIIIIIIITIIIIIIIK